MVLGLNYEIRKNFAENPVFFDVERTPEIKLQKMSIFFRSTVTQHGFLRTWLLKNATFLQAGLPDGLFSNQKSKFG
jgi:hypothetical protein